MSGPKGGYFLPWASSGNLPLMGAPMAPLLGWHAHLPANCGRDIPVFLLTVFAKNEKATLTTRERKALIAAAKQIVDNYGRSE